MLRGKLHGPGNAGRELRKDDRRSESQQETALVSGTKPRWRRHRWKRGLEAEGRREEEEKLWIEVGGDKVRLP